MKINLNISYNLLKYIFSLLELEERSFSDVYLYTKEKLKSITKSDLENIFCFLEMKGILEANFYPLKDKFNKYAVGYSLTPYYFKNTQKAMEEIIKERKIDFKIKNDVIKAIKSILKSKNNLSFLEIKEKMQNYYSKPLSWQDVCVHLVYLLKKKVIKKDYFLVNGFSVEVYNLIENDKKVYDKND